MFLSFLFESTIILLPVAFVYKYSDSILNTALKLRGGNLTGFVASQGLKLAKSTFNKLKEQKEKKKEEEKDFDFVLAEFLKNTTPSTKLDKKEQQNFFTFLMNLSYSQPILAACFFTFLATYTIVHRKKVKKN